MPPTKTAPWKVSTFLVCDDVRMEVSRKYILVGVYAGIVLVHKEPPITLPQLRIFVSLRLAIGQHHLKIRILDPDLKEVWSGGVEFEIKDSDEEIGIPIPFSPAVLPKLGRYNVRFARAGEKFSDVGSFVVRFEPRQQGDTPRA